MLISLLVVLAAAPAPKLTSLDAPLGNFGAVVGPMPASGMKDSDRPIIFAPAGCDQSVIYLMRNLGGMIKATEQLQAWLARQPGLEKKLFKDKDVLALTVAFLTGADAMPKKSCAAVSAPKGRVLLDEAPKKFCAKDQPDGLTWFFNKNLPAAVISVVPSESNACQPRLSTVLFDGKGKARVRLHADWAGAMSATIVGDGCQLIEFTFDSATQSFVPGLASCKR